MGDLGWLNVKVRKGEKFADALLLAMEMEEAATILGM